MYLPTIVAALANATHWVASHPVQAAAVGGGAVLVAAPMAAAAPVLGAAGFGAKGVVGGSVAATIHSSIGNVVTGSDFLCCRALLLADTVSE
ncbi:hypothetical protein F5Y17DRAFT_438814 [Xylariaceae sp. FL0594]|nr:hypothetical protein F5Y17DRAFT_438814 [Xylariaceae sp. FL0594]